MAKTKLKTVPPAQKEDWEKELADQARDEKSRETLGVPRVTHQGSLLQIDGKKVADKVVRAVVLGLVYSKEWQEHEYTPGAKDTPACYAFGTTGDKGLSPHIAAPKKQNADCDTCPNNRFGTALKGKGKRCQDRRRLIFLLADDLQKEGETQVERAILKAPHYQISVPPGSLKNFGSYLRSLADLTPNGSIREAITEIGTEARPTGGHELTFAHLGNVPKQAMPFLIKRGATSNELLMQPFPVIESEEAAPQQKAKPIKGQGKNK